MSARLISRVTADGYQISIASKKYWFMLLFLPLWLAAWTVGGVQAIRSLQDPRSGQPALFMVVWLVLWAFAELFAAYAWLWNAFGKEVVTVRVGNLVLKRDILGFGRSGVFPVSEISQLRSSGLYGSFLFGWAGSLNYWGLSGGVIAFESGGKTHRFGIHLEEDEARQVVAELVKHLPKLPSLRGANSNER